MRDRLHKDREFNTAGEIVARLTFLLTHAALAAGIVLMLAGVVALHVTLSLAGAIALGLAWAGRNWLMAHGQFEPSEQALNAILQAAPPLDDARVAELIALLEQWEALEQKRGSPEFDPWAVQALRHDIRMVVESDPALEQLFTTLQRAA